MAKNKRNQTAKRKAVRPVKAQVLANNVSPRPIKRRSNRAKRVLRSGPKRAGDVHIRSVCSVTDPFCPAAKNSKWPDGTGGNTLTEQIRGNLTLVTQGANGNNMYCFTPTAPYGYLAGATSTATTVTMAAASVLYKTAPLVATYGSNYRVVSFGVIVRCVASATAAAGIVTLGTGPAPAVGGTYTLGEELYQETVIKAIQPGMEISMISTPKGTGARDFQAQSTTTAFTSDWSTLWVEITGAANSASLLNAEWFLNIEFEPLQSARALTAIAKSNPPKSSAAEQAVSNVHSTVGSFIEGGVTSVEKMVYDHATKALNTLMSDPLESIAGLFSML